MKKFALLIFIISLIIYPSVASGQVDIYSNVGSEVIAPTWAPQANSRGTEVANILSRFMYYREFKKLDSAITQVIEVQLPQGSSADKSKYALVEDQTTTFQPFEIVSNEQKIKFSVLNSTEGSDILDTFSLYDSNLESYTQFPVKAFQTSVVKLLFVYEKPVTTSILYLQLAQNSEPPTHVSLKTLDFDKEEIIVAEKQFQGDIRFTSKTASIWELTLKYTQPLRITEAYFVDENSYQRSNQSIRFLMRPGSPYLLFSEPDGYVTMPYLESGNLYSTTDDLVLDLPPAVANPLYRPADDDADGVSNSLDNCPSVKNTNQKDVNKNGLGDGCEDFDKDYIMNADDNCPEHPNRDQQDADGDKVGDHCDTEESRLTERLGFLPWLGIVVGFGVVIAMFAFTVKKPVDLLPKEEKKKEDKLTGK